MTPLDGLRWPNCLPHRMQAGPEVFGAAPRIYVSQQPLLPPATCERYIAAAEAWAARSGGWTTSRHYSGDVI